MKSKKLITILGIVIGILCIPLIAMQFTAEVNWDLTDFIVFGVLLLGIILAIDFALSRLKNSKYKVPVIIALIILFLLIWAELGVGIFGTPFAGN